MKKFRIKLKYCNPEKDLFGKNKHYVLQIRRWLFFWKDNQYVENNEESYKFLNKLNNE